MKHSMKKKKSAKSYSKEKSANKKRMKVREAQKEYTGELRGYGFYGGNDSV